VIGGGWASSAFGAVFLLPGLALMMIGFHLIPISGEDFMVNGVPVLGLFGLPFFLVGGSLICWRRWLTFNLSRRSLVIQSTVLVPIISKERILQEFTAVAIYRQIESSSSGNGPTQFVEYYSVQLIARTIGDTLIINNYNAYGDAYGLAAKLAAFLSVPVSDIASDHPVEIAPADVAHPLQARLRADAADMQQCVKPATLRSQVTESPDGVRISIPGQRSSRFMYLLVLVITAVGAAVFLPIFLKTFAVSGHTPAFIQYPMIGGVVLILGYSLLSLLKHDLIASLSSTVVSIDRQRLSIEKRRGKRIRKAVLLPIPDILDIDYNVVNDRRKPHSSGLLGMATGSRGITVKAKTGLYTFGAGLPDAEVEYLASVVEKALRATLIQAVK